MATQPKRLGEQLIEAGLLDAPALESALATQRATGERLGEVLVRQGQVSGVDLLRVLCQRAGIPFRSLADVEPDPAAVALLPESVARAKLEIGRAHV